MARGDICGADKALSLRSLLAFDWQDSSGLIWRSLGQLLHAFGMHHASIETGPADPKKSTGLAGIADLLGVLEHSKLALNIAFVVRHEYFLHPKSGNL